MADEDVEKKMEFIIEQQAQFASKMGQLEDIVTRLATASLNRFESIEETSSQRFDNIDEKIGALVDSQIRTDESLRNLIAVVDRYFSEGRNGKSED
jgi:septal ring factor EnvC (AmiA/AmiB activator)